MYSHIDNVNDNQNRSVVNEDASKQGGNDYTDFVDNSPEAKEAAQLQAMADNSPEAKEAAQLQAMADNSPEAKEAAQLQAMADNSPEAEQPIAAPNKPNNTGLPDELKLGIENLSGYSLDDVKVHYNSDKPAELQAHAYAQGTDIYLGPGQEKHLPHEVWHVVQQKQGRVKPTMQMKGKVNINDDVGLEKEADVMGEKALQLLVDTKSIINFEDDSLPKSQVSPLNSNISSDVIQGVFVYSFPSHSIIDTDKDDKYYEDIGFIRVINPFGGFVWADRRNVEDVKELLGYFPNITDNGMSEVYAFTIRAPTHDKDWQLSTEYDVRINCILEALKIIYSTYDPSKLYILTAPEYFFAAQNKNSHFMDKNEFNNISGQLQSIASSLPPNLVMVPGTIGYSEVIPENELESEVGKLQIKHNQLLNYVSSYNKVAEQNYDNMAVYDIENVEKEYNLDWNDEINRLKDKDSAKKLFNRALVFYNQTMEVYDKMFESLSGEKDKGKGDDGTLFEHGTAPFMREYNGIKIALQICSDYAYESLRGLEFKPDIQLVPASNYGTAEGFQQAKTLLKADSKGSTVIKMGEESTQKQDQKWTHQEQDQKWTLSSSIGTTLSYHSIKK